MVLAPRFRPGSARRAFVNREHALESFADMLAQLERGGDPAVLVLAGIGGIGKSRLISELKGRLDDAYGAAVLDLQVPAQRQPETALAVLRSQFGASGVRFPRFDIAYTTLWQRLHPHLRVTTDTLALAGHSEVLTDILDEATGIPVFGTAAKLVEGGIRRTTRWRWMRADPTLQELDLLGLPALTDAVVYLLAEDLKASGKRYVLFVDAYEALVGGSAREGRIASVDGWLRDVVAQLDGGVVVVASREPLGWQRHDADWIHRLHTIAVDDLPMAARRELLVDAGVTEEAEIAHLASASAGVPFYLHLALDARAAGTTSGRAAVDPGAILERFLHHVDPDEIRTLELLSIARIFDYEIFTGVADEFAVTAPERTWEAIGRYSFLRPAGRPGQFQMHQLMVEALRARVPERTTEALHSVLHGLWTQRCSAPADRAASLREAIYHGVRGRTLDSTRFIDAIDELVAAGGKQAIDGVLADLEQYLASAPVDDRMREQFALGVRCLRAEAAVLLGDGVVADVLTADVDLAASGPIADRYAVVAGHASRIRGRTAEALGIYTAVLTRGSSGSARRGAGLWAADLHMAQGRFADALAIAGELLGDAEGGPEYLAEVERLRSLACRFCMDHEGAARHLAAAELLSEQAGSVVLAANLAVNRLELLAMTDPASAIDQAGRAIEAQRELGARHEIGKAYTAVGVACLALGDLEAAGRALGDAREVLDEVGYRSGRARADLFHAIVHARRGEREPACDTVRRAVAELQDAEVYPVLIVAADAVLSLFGWYDEAVSAAAELARQAVQLPNQEASLDARLAETLTRLLGTDPRDMYQSAMGRVAAAGFYNRNVRVNGPFGPVNVRVAEGEADEMDLRLLAEPQVLRAVAPLDVNVPRLRWVGLSPQFLLQDHVDGVLLDEIAPRGTALPAHIVLNVVALFETLVHVPRSALGVPPSWPDDGDVVAVARRVGEITQRVVDRNSDTFGRLWVALGVPPDPLNVVREQLATLTSRRFRLVHADLHRKNMMIRDESTVFLDWELAMWGDPLYDLATHIHKMGYLTDEQDQLLARWRVAEPQAASGRWDADLDVYLNHERVKSVIVDSVRYAKRIRAGVSADEERHLTANLVAKLQTAAPVWGIAADAEVERVGRALRLSEN